MKLQADLIVEKGSGGLPRDAVSANEDGTNVVRSADGQSGSDTLPVFRSESGVSFARVYRPVIATVIRPPWARPSWTCIRS